MTLVLDGEKPQKEIAEKLRKGVGELSKPPSLIIFSVDPDRESLLYIEKKKKFGAEVGCVVEHVSLDPSSSIEDNKRRIEEKNEDSGVDGMIVQLPVTPRSFTAEILNSVEPSKDVDGLSDLNTSALFRGEERIIPATTRGILEMLDFYNLSVKGKKVVIVGRSMLVGRPTAMAFINREATVSICHRGTPDLVQEVFSADVVVSATGKPGIISSKMMHSEQIILDVGISVGDDGSIRGDVDIDDALKVVKAVSPVPGGIGPLTVASLFLNLLESIERRN